MSDEETVQELSAELICEYLTKAIEDLKETNDYISYATLLDIHLSDAERYSDDEKSLILKTLIKVLEENPDISYEIGWDLPELLLGFFDLEWDFEGSLLRSTDVIKNVMNAFDVIAKSGNPKELFLRSIELLSGLDYSSLVGEDDKASKIMDIKLHVLIELLSTSLKRISTIYPSKFLAMALAALLKSYVSYNNVTSNVRIIARRLYLFARDYIPPLKPVDYIEQHGLTQEEADKLDDDENYLQRTLLQSFLTHIFGISFKTRSPSNSLHLYGSLQSKNTGKFPKFVIKSEGYEDDQTSSTKILFVRIITLMLSYDIEIEDEFTKLKEESVELFSNIDSNLEEDEKIQNVLKIAINDKVSHLFHPETEKIPINSSGLLVSIIYHALETQKILPISVSEAIALALRFLSPGVMSESFNNFGLYDAVLFWSWAAIRNATSSDFKNIPKYQIILYLQILVFYSSTTSDSDYRMITITLFTRVLSLIDESIAYDFIINTLTTAPYENAKACIILILKDLSIRERVNVDDISDKLSKTTITKEENKTLPKLPKRHYIELTKSRLEDVYALIRETIDDTFQENGEFASSEKFKLLLSYINFLITFKNKFAGDEIIEIKKACEQKVKNYKNSNKNPPSELQNGDNIEFLTLSLEFL
ncbi:hypothetical protein WICMUC_002863 [Wickerhamomyces mucosus]|uniref:Uncharacterized protein n=1 Tax=Wickerhamomyces mucosus TaxID=1378264 RepID=A0A9P8TDE4_9ASCO|nr:hypothetical protein WICMUC_002863 [Wickerhamomyces mucosus]